MDLSISKYRLNQQDPTRAQASITNTLEVKSTLSSYTTYQIKVNDSKGELTCNKRYSEFDLLRQWLLKRWPGCYVPPLPEKKMVGNNEANFVQCRRIGLDIFIRELATLPHLWYSEEVDIFLRKAGDLQANFKQLPTQTHQDIIKKYDQKFTRLRGKSIDTNLISKVLQFNKYLKRVAPVLEGYKAFLLSFSEIKSGNYDQFAILFNYVLPEYEKICLTSYLNHNTEGKLIFSDEHDEKMASYISKIKSIIEKSNFDQLLVLIQQQQRQINGFLDVYKQHAVYQKKVHQYKQKQKQLLLQQQKLALGKQGLFKSIFKSNIEQDKKNIERQISVNKDFITSYSMLSDMITILLGFYEIDRFREAKINKHVETMKRVAKVQVELLGLQKEMCKHVLDNHNLI